MANVQMREAVLSAFEDERKAKTTEEVLNAMKKSVDRRAAQREIPLLIQAGFLAVTKDFKLVPADGEEK